MVAVRRRFACLLLLVVCVGCRRTTSSQVNQAADEALPDRTIVVESDSPAVSADGTVLLQDVGIETLGGVMTVLLPKGLGVPCKKTEVFSTASDGQTEVKIAVYRGGAPLVKEDHALGSFQAIGIPPAPRGVPSVSVTFSLKGRSLLMRAVNSTTQSAMVIVRPNGRLHDAVPGFEQ